MSSLENLIIAAIVLASPLCLAYLWRWDILRPGSLTRLGAAGRLRNPARVHSAAWLAACIATLLAASVGAALTASALGVAPPVGEGPAPAIEPHTAALAELGAYCLAIVVGILCAALLARTGRLSGGEHGAADARSLGLFERGGAWRDALRGLGGLLLVLPLCLTVGIALSQVATALGGDPPRVGHSALREMVDRRHEWHAWLRAGLAILGAPVVEELMYRVFLQSAIISGLARLRAIRVRANGAGVGGGGSDTATAGDAFWGIALSSAAFVLPHAAALSGPASWNALPSLAILGVGLGVVYERTRSPIAPIVMHMGFNALNVAAALATA